MPLGCNEGDRTFYDAIINDKVKGEFFKSPSNVKETEQKGCDIDGFFISN